MIGLALLHRDNVPAMRLSPALRKVLLGGATRAVNSDHRLVTLHWCIAQVLLPSRAVGN